MAAAFVRAARLSGVLTPVQVAEDSVDETDGHGAQFLLVAGTGRRHGVHRARPWRRGFGAELPDDDGRSA